MAITTYDQAIAFANSPQGQALPGLWWVVDDLKYYKTTKSIREKNRQRFLNPLIQKVDKAQQNPIEFVKDSLSREIGNYLRQYRTVQLDPHPQQQARLETWKSSLNKSVNFLIQNKVPATDIQKIFTNAEGNYKAAIERDIQMQSQKNVFDRILDVADTLIVGGLTGGLGLSPVNAAALSSAIAIANGADVKQALQAGLAGLTANQVGQYLQTVNAISANDVVNSAVTNAARSASAAAVMGTDVKTAALSGLAGGATAGALFKATDRQAISRAAGEYTQAVASGMSPQNAMLQALSGFADEEMAQAKRNIEQEAVLQQAKIKPPVSAQDQVVDAFSQPKSPGVGTQIGAPTASADIDTGTRTDVEPNRLPEVVVSAERQPDTTIPSSMGINLSVLPSPLTRPQPTTPQIPKAPSLPEVVVSAEKEEPPTETITETEKPIELSTPKAGVKTETEEEVATGKEKISPILLSLLGGQSTYYLGDRGGAGIGGAQPSTSALAQALSVGDPGALYLGKKGTQRKPVWNVESLKLSDELGGTYG